MHLVAYKQQRDRVVETPAAVCGIEEIVPIAMLADDVFVHLVGELSGRLIATSLIL